jgi:hypothetical protein
MYTYTNEDLLHHHTSSIHYDGIHHINLFPKESGSLSMRYMSGIVVSVTLILDAFEYVAFKAAFDYRKFAWKLCSLNCFTLVVYIAPQQVVTLRDVFSIGRSP